MLKCPDTFAYLDLTLYTWDGCCNPLFQREAWLAWICYKPDKDWSRRDSTSILFSYFFVPVIWVILHCIILHYISSCCCCCILLCCTLAAAFVFWLSVSLFFGTQARWISRHPHRDYGHICAYSHKSHPSSTVRWSLNNFFVSAKSHPDGWHGFPEGSFLFCQEATVMLYDLTFILQVSS